MEERRGILIDATGIHEFIIMNGIIYFIIRLITATHEKERRASEMSVSSSYSRAKGKNERAESNVNSIEDKINKYNAIHGERGSQNELLKSGCSLIQYFSLPPHVHK